MITALSPFGRGLAMAAVLVSLVVASNHAPAARADNGGSGGSGPIVCTQCPQLPQPPSLDQLQLTAENDAVVVKGEGFSSWGGVDLYIWQQNNGMSSYGVYAGPFAGTVHTTANGSALSFRLSAKYKAPKGIRLVEYATYVVAIDDETHLSSGIQELDTAAPVTLLALAPATSHPSLHAGLNATTGVIHLNGRHYTPHTPVAVYLLPNGTSLPASVPTTLTAKGARFATTLATGHTGCSDTLSWTTFALDQTANAASPLLTVKDPCTVVGPPK